MSDHEVGGGGGRLHCGENAGVGGGEKLHLSEDSGPK
jgi:hypothetical protein